MLETVITIILAPVALASIALTVAIGVAIIKTFKQKK
jgi:hypothetical protein